MNRLWMSFIGLAISATAFERLRSFETDAVKKIQEENKFFRELIEKADVNSALAQQAVTELSLLEAKPAFRFRRNSATTLEMVQTPLIGNPVLVSNATDRMLTHLKNNLSADISQVGPGGLAKPLTKDVLGLDVFLITMSGGKGAQLLLNPQRQEVILPNGYTMKSEILWYVQVRENRIRNFFDLGGGRCQYITTAETHSRFWAKRGSPKSLLNYTQLRVPINASLIYYLAEVALPNARPRQYQAGVWFNTIHSARSLSELIYRPPLPNLQIATFEGEVPFGSVGPNGEIWARFSGAKKLQSDSTLVAPPGKTHTGGLMYYITGWKLDRQF
jgi:hypothetical protein